MTIAGIRPQPLPSEAQGWIKQARTLYREPATDELVDRLDAALLLLQHSRSAARNGADGSPGTVQRREFVKVVPAWSLGRRGGRGVSSPTLGAPVAPERTRRGISQRFTEPMIVR